MVLVIATKKMTFEQKLSLQSNYQYRFDTIKKGTGVLTGVLAAPDANKPASPNQSLLKDRPLKTKIIVLPAEAFRHIGIPSMYEKKARKLLTMILEHLNIHQTNAACEMVVNSVVVLKVLQLAI